MKKLVLISLVSTLLSSSAFAKFFQVTLTEETEPALLEKVEETIPLILKGKVRSVFHDRDCWPNNKKTIKVTSVEVNKAYDVDSQGNLNPYYIGKIHYKHKSCRTGN